MEKIGILLVDDHLIIRDAIKLMLKKKAEFEIVAEASNGKEAIACLSGNSHNIDVVLMDINMSEMDGIETTQIVTERFSNVNVLALTMHAEAAYIKSMLQAGALGYILKESGTSELMYAIKEVSSGRKYYSNEVSVTMIDSLVEGNLEETSPLSERESEVLSHVASGYTNKEVGNILYISGRTVETHRRNILDKLDLRNTAEMIRYAIENQLVA